MSGSLPNRLADWLELERSGGEAATWRLDVAWPWPPWATLLFVLAATVWVVFCYRQEAGGAGRRYRALLAALRLAAIAVLLVMLTGATLSVQRTGPPMLALVVDRSASMGIVDPDGDSPGRARLAERLSRSELAEPSRLGLAKLLLLEDDAQLLAHMLENYALAVYWAADGIERARFDDGATLTAAVRALTADGPASGATRLGDAMRHVLDDLRGAPPAAILMLTDGVVTAGTPLAEAAQLARSRGVPLVAVGLGNERPPRDVEVADLLVDDAVFVDDLVSFTIRVKSTGLEGQRAQVVLRREGQTAPLAEQTVELGPDGQLQTVQLIHRPTAPGEIPFVVEIAPRDDEVNPDNNYQRRTVAVRDEPIRVLLAFGYPNYEFRFLKTLLERDSTIELATFLQDADPEYAEQDRTALRSFPISRDELFDYDVLVIGDLNPRLLPRSLWQQVQAFVVEKGGGAVFVAGPRYLPWMYGELPEVAGLLPIDPLGLDAGGEALAEEVTRGFTVRPTPLGLRLPPLQLGDTPAESERVWQNLAPLYWLVEIEQLKPAAQVLAEHPTRTSGPGRRLPLFVSQYVGAGRVLFHATDSTWRWRVGVGDVYFARYWVQTIRHLARGKLESGRGAQLATDHREYGPRDAVQVRLRFLDQRLAPSDDEAIVLVDTPGQARQRMTLRRDPAAAGLFQGTLTGLREGQYELLLAEPQIPGGVPSARFAVVAPAGEMARIEMDRAALEAAAELTRGNFYTLAGAGRLVEELPRGRRTPIENLAPLEIWNRWWLLATFVALLTSEWILRKRQGML